MLSSAAVVGRLLPARGAWMHRALLHHESLHRAIPRSAMVAPSLSIRSGAAFHSPLHLAYIHVRSLSSNNGKGGPFGWWSDDSNSDDSDHSKNSKNSKNSEKSNNSENSKNSENAKSESLDGDGNDVDSGASEGEGEFSSKKRRRKSRGSSLLRSRRNNGGASGISFTSESSGNGKDEAVESNASTGDAASLDPNRGQLVYSKAPFLPEVLVVPYKHRPVFPPYTVPMQITQEPLIEALETVRTSATPYVALFLEKDLSEQEQNAASSPPVTVDSLYDIGTFAQVLKVQENKPAHGPADREREERVKSWTVMMRVHRRVQLLDILDAGPPITAKIEHLSEKPVEFYNQETIKAYTNEILRHLRDLLSWTMMRDEVISSMLQRTDASNPYLLADFAASLTSAEPHQLQEVLETLNLETRLDKVLLLLKQEHKMMELQQEITKQVESKMSDNQRKYFLGEQLKHIKKELGLEHDDKEALLTRFRERIDELNAIEPGIPEDALKVITEEISKLGTLEKNSAEFNITRTYLDWLTQLPWSKASVDNFDLDAAKTVLEEDHYGLADIKERIMEFIAVGKLRGAVQGKILLLVGPPGVGKTSIGKSIARALNREFYRLSVGGLSDVSEIKGHRRTYVGAMPGKMIQCLKNTAVSNPLVLIDEIDKVGSDYRGDPASALLELLDPSQNSSFMDHYLDVPVDVSKVLFVCTANVTDTIPGPLLDRMEVLRLSGYDLPEKVSIAQQYLEPKAKEECGLIMHDPAENLDDDDYDESDDHAEGPPPQFIPPSLSITKEALETLSRSYCREAGVRSLQQHIERIYRKAALKILQSTEEELHDEEKWRIKEEDLIEYVGQPRFPNERLYSDDVTPPGVVMGLAWTSTGGSALYVESTNVKKSKLPDGQSDADADTGSGASGLFVTGQLGDVMKESSQIAYTHARHKLNEIDEGNSFFDVNRIHLHTPEGATPKDGPSAGVSMTTALLSLAMAKPVKQDLAMTGEMSLTGMVLPVGGIKEKVIAARRSGVKTIVLPQANQRDVEELADYLKEDLDIRYARVYDDVFKVAFEEH